MTWSSSVSSLTACDLEGGKPSGYFGAARCLLWGIAPGRWRCSLGAFWREGGVSWPQSAQPPCPTRTWTLAARLVITLWNTPHPMCACFAIPPGTSGGGRHTLEGQRLSFFPKGTLGVGKSNLATHTPSSSGGLTSGFPGMLNSPGMSLNPPPPPARGGSPSLLLCIRPFATSLKRPQHKRGSHAGKPPCLARWGEAAAEKVKLNRPLMDSEVAGSWLCTRCHGCFVRAGLPFGPE